MLVYITNRKLPITPTSKPVNIAVKKISQKLNVSKVPGQNVIVSGVASNNYKNIKFYPRGKESDLFDGIDKKEYKKPWLVFLHGFHQDPEETVEKAMRLESIHGVNVVLFSWPSHPKPVKTLSKDSVVKELKDYALTLLLGARRPSLVGFFLEEIKKFIDDYKNNYVPARKNAEKSTTDFYAALEIVNQQLLPRINPSKLSLIVHSMGNYLLERTLYDKNNLPLKFWNIVSHQADVKASNHASWLSGLFGYSANKLYVTVNVLDAVLAASNLLHRLNKERDCERLGQSSKLKPEGLHQGYIQNIVHYLDFTDGEGVDIEHEIFTRKSIENKGDVDKNIVGLLGRIFRSESDKLPVKRGRSKSGFSMMPTVPMVYKPQWIIEDENLCDDGPDEDCRIRSLSVFDDPFKKEPDYIPELEDD